MNQETKTDTTHYLTKNAANKAHLDDAIAALNRGEGVEFNPCEKFGESAPTNHSHEPMKWTLADIKLKFPSGKFTQVSLVGRNKEIMQRE